MANLDSNPNDGRLEEYLDGLLGDPDRAAFEAALGDDPELARKAALQGRIDEALGRMFRAAAPSQERVAALLAQPAAARASGEFPRSATARSAASAGGGARRYWVAAAAAAAAIVAWMIFAAPWSADERAGPQFAARPLADIYRQAVQSGFEPSYDCREPERFAAAFNARQGQPLRLLAMPDEMQMLGLAYVGGLSRNTTAMLCRVEGAPVMVFVDRASADQAVAEKHAGDGLHVFRDQRDGLVFYEVTPLEEPRASELIVPLDAVDASGAQ